MRLRKLQSMQCLGVWTALLVIVVQPQWVLAEESSPESLAPSNILRGLTVVDVAVDRDGVLRGQVVDKQGRSLAGEEIALTNEKLQLRTLTDQQGRFELRGITGATYQAQVGQQIQLMRVWSPGTAPPSASQGLMFVQDSDVVLAQYCGSPVCGSAVGPKHHLANPWIFGGLVAAAIAIPVAIHNSDNDDQPPMSPTGDP